MTDLIVPEQGTSPDAERPAAGRDRYASGVRRKADCEDVRNSWIDGAIDQLLDAPAALRSERDARALVDRFRFPRGFCCPRCGSTRAPWERGALLACASCRHPVPPTAGTPFSGPHPLVWWLRALWLATDAAPFTAAALAEALNIPVDTAGELHDRLRTQWRRTAPLEGVVYVEARSLSALGGREVALALELSAGAAARCRLASVREPRGASITRFVAEAVAPASILITPLDEGFAELAAGFDLRQQEKLPRSRVPDTPDPDETWAALAAHLDGHDLSWEDLEGALLAFAWRHGTPRDRHDRFAAWLRELLAPPAPAHSRAA